MNQVLQTITNGFTYAGETLHILLNYFLLAVTILPHILRGNKTGVIKNKWLGALLISLAVQVLIWFAADAAGISVIWCSMAGFNLLVLTKEKKELNSTARYTFTSSVIAALLLFIYYMVSFPAITTIAHVMGVIMGIVLFYLPRKKFHN